MTPGACGARWIGNPFRDTFSETEARFPELDRAHVAQRRVHVLVVVPPNVAVGLHLEVMQAAGLLPVRELGLQRLVGRLVDRVVERAPLLRQRPGDLEHLGQLVQRRVVELRAPVRVEDLMPLAAALTTSRTAEPTWNPSPSRLAPSRHSSLS